MIEAAMMREDDEPLSDWGEIRPAPHEAIYTAMLAAAPPRAVGRGDVRGLEYVPGELDRTAPPRIWLQIDTSADNSERDDKWPEPDGVSWFWESIGGLEIQYVRADLALAAEGVQAGEVGQRLASARAGVTRTAMVWCKDIKDGSAAHAFENAIEELERAAIASALSQQPEARGVVDEAMIERGTVAAISASTRYAGTGAGDAWRSLVRDVLTAALTGERNG